MAGKTRQILYRLAGDPSEARRAFAEVREDMRDLDKQRAEAVATIKTDAAQARLAQLRAQLTRLGEQEATPAVTIRVGRTLEQIERLEAKLDGLSRKHVDVDLGAGGIEKALGKATGRQKVKVDVDVDRNTFTSRIGSALKDAFSGVSGALSGVVSGVGAALRGVPALGAGIAALAAGGLTAIPVFIVLGAVLTALAASFTAAVLGAGVLATALGGALLPVLAVGVGIVVSLTKVFKSLTDGQKDHTNQTRAVADATRAVGDAQQGVVDAQANLKSTTTDAWRAYHDAIETVKDDLRDVEHARLNIDQAKLSTEQAQNELDKFKGGLVNQFAELQKFTDVHVSTSGLESAIGKTGASRDDQLQLQQLILNVRDAKLREKDATDGLGDSTTKLARDRKTEATFLRQGIAAYPAYTAALKQVSTAERQLADAERNRARAQSDMVKEIRTLNPVERGLATTLLATKNAISALFSPAVNAALDGFTKSIGSIQSLLTDTGLQSALTNVGKAIGDVFRSFGRDLGSSRNINAFTILGNGAARLVRLLGSHVFKDLFDILRDIAVVALKPLEDRIRSVARYFDQLAGSTKKGDGLKRFVDSVVKSFDDWIGLIKAVGGLLATVFEGSKKSGDGLVRTLTRIVNRFNEWLQDDKNRKKFKDFLLEMKGIFQDIYEILRAAKKVYDAIFHDGSRKNSSGDVTPGGTGAASLATKILKGTPFDPTPRRDIKPINVQAPTKIPVVTVTPQVNPRPRRPDERFGSRGADFVVQGDIIVPPAAGPKLDPQYDSVKFARHLKKLGAATP